MRLPKVTFGKNFPDSRVSDYMIYDQVTGFKIWRSEAQKLNTYTGKGGLLTHNHIANNVYTIDYGLVPYKVPAERPIRDTAENHIEPEAIGVFVLDSEDTPLMLDGGGGYLEL